MFIFSQTTPILAYASPLLTICFVSRRKAIDQWTEATPEELSFFAEQLVRHTENGKAMLKLMQAGCVGCMLNFTRSQVYQICLNMGAGVLFFMKMLMI